MCLNFCIHVMLLFEGGGSLNGYEKWKDNVPNNPGEGNVSSNVDLNSPKSKLDLSPDAKSFCNKVESFVNSDKIISRNFSKKRIAELSKDIVSDAQDINWKDFDFEALSKYVNENHLTGDQSLKLFKETIAYKKLGFSFDNALRKAIEKTKGKTNTSTEYINTLKEDKENNNDGDKAEILSKLQTYINQGVDVLADNFKIEVGDTYFGSNVSSIIITDEKGNKSIKLEDLLKLKLGDGSTDFISENELKSFVLTSYKENIESLIEADLNKPGHDANSLAKNLFSPVYSKLLGFYKRYIKLFYDEGDKNKTNEEIQKGFKAFCASLGYEIADVDEKLLNDLKEREKKFNIIRQKIENRNKAINERRTTQKLDYKIGMHEDKESKSIDFKTATGAEIAKNANLGKQILETFNPNPKLNGFLEGTNNQRLKNISFNIAWTNFLKNKSFLFEKDGKNIGISSILTENKMHRIFDINQDTPSINNTNLDKFLDNINYSEEEKGKIRDTLVSFTEEFKNTLKELVRNSKNGIGYIHETVNNHAIGAVIDNVKNIFSGIGEKLKQGANFHGFEFDDKQPAKINGNNLVMSGILDGAAINIRYNLSSGQLYMNSFINENVNPPMMTVGGNEANIPIGSFISFNDILKDYYKSPTPSTEDKSNNGPEVGYKPISQGNKGNMVSDPKSPLNSQKANNSEEIRKENVSNFKKTLNQQIENIGATVQNSIQSQSKKNSVVSKFLKTFNILKDNETNPIYFEGGGNMFDALQIIKNSDAATLDRFQTFMNSMMGYAGLKRGENNESQKQDWKDNIFPSEDDEDGKLFVSAMSNFDKEKINFEQKNQFGRNDILGFADIIKEKLAIGDPPDQKLSILKMDTFMENINSCAGAEAILNKALNNIN